MTLGWAPPASGGRILSAHDTSTRPQVGTIMPASSKSGQGGHTCTGSVIDSPSGDLVLTAAHCIDGDGTDLTFVPGFADGKRPQGTWTVTAAYVDENWKTSQDDRFDYAVLRVADQQRGGHSVSLQDVTGALQVATAHPDGTPIDVVAYNNDNDSPQGCSTHIVNADGFPSFHCDGYETGSSGAPWIGSTDGPDGSVQTVVGVIGGRNQGGCVSHTSFSSPFSDETMALVHRADAGGSGDDVPAPGDDGCGL